MTSSTQTAKLEVEAKFWGSQQDCDRIVGWLAEQGFKIERKEPVHRVHVYFDDHGRLRTAGCRLRCVIAPGEWCRYDFKTTDADGLVGIMEASVAHPTPVPVAQAVTELLQKLPVSGLGKPLDSINNTLAIALVMTGTHYKTVAECDALKLEVSWDLMVPLDSGIALSEVEVELLHGELPAFESLVQRMAESLSIHPHTESKYASAVRAMTSTPPCAQSAKSVVHT